MGFSAYLQCFRDGKPAGLPRDMVAAQFPIGNSSSTDLWQIKYDDENWCDIYVSPDRSNGAKIHGLTVDRPCGDLRLWNALYRVMCLGPVVFYFPGSNPLRVAHEATIAQLPADLLEAIGPPRLVSSGQELRQAVEDDDCP